MVIKSILTRREIGLMELADTQTANDRIIQISMIVFSKSPTLWTLGSGERGRGQKGRFVHTLDLAHIA